jgi:hypothetical protein
VAITKVKSLVARYYRPKSRHAPTGTYVKRFGHQEDVNCKWGRSGTLQRWEHLFRHCSRWKDQKTALWKALGKATGWNVSRCRQVQISELFSLENCDQAVMDFLAATDVGKFPPELAEEFGQDECGQDQRSLDRGRSLSLFVDLLVVSNHVHLIDFPLSQGTVGSRWELRHLAGSPGGGGVVLGSVIL